jgi:hypothetical protein
MVTLRLLRCFFYTMSGVKTLNSPHGLVGLFYYKRKLSFLNFTVCGLDSQEGFCYMWPKTNGRNEACKLKDDVKVFRFWFDNCAV